MNTILSEALARLQPMTVAQASRLARCIDRTIDTWRDAVQAGAVAEAELLPLVIGVQLDDIAEAVAIVAGVNEETIRDLSLADFGEFLAALLTRLQAVNEAPLRDRFVPSLSAIAAALSQAKASAPRKASAAG